MNKKITYLVSALAMLMLTITIGFIFSQDVPSTQSLQNDQNKNKLQDIFNAQDDASEIDTLPPIANLITQSAEGKPLTEKYPQVEHFALSELNDLTFTEEPKIGKEIPIKEIPIDPKAQETPQAIAILDNNIETNKTDNLENTKEEQEFSSPIVSTETPQKEQIHVQSPPEPAKTTPVKQETRVENPSTNKPATRTNSKVPPLKGNPLVTKSTLVATSNSSTISSAVLSMDGDQVQLALEGNNPISATTFIMDNPDRVVLDIKGSWFISVPRVASNRMVKEARLGKTATATRIVFDLRVVPKNSRVIRISDKKIVLVFN